MSYYSDRNVNRGTVKIEISERPHEWKKKLRIKLFSITLDEDKLPAFTSRDRYSGETKELKIEKLNLKFSYEDYESGGYNFLNKAGTHSFDEYADGGYFNMISKKPEESKLHLELAGIDDSWGRGKLIKCGEAKVGKLSQYRFNQRLKIKIRTHVVMLSVYIEKDSLKEPIMHTKPGRVGNMCFHEDVYLKSVERPQIAFANSRALMNTKVCNWINEYDKYIDIINISRDSGYAQSWGMRDRSTNEERSACYICATIFFRRNNIKFGEEGEKKKKVKTVKAVLKKKKIIKKIIKMKKKLDDENEKKEEVEGEDEK